MSQLLEIQPSNELKFIFEVMKQSTCNVRLINKTDQYVAFKVKTTSPRKYCVRPNVGVVLPKETFDFVVLMQSQRSPPADMVCKDKFLVQSTIVPDGTMEEDVTSYMFSKDDGKYIEERKLKVILVSPPHSPELSPMHPKFKMVPPVEGSVVADGTFSRTERHSSHHVDVEHAKVLKIANKEVQKSIADVKSEVIKSVESELTEAAEPMIVRDVESQPIKAVGSDSEDNLVTSPVKETKPSVMDDAMDLRLVKDVELTEEAEPTNMMNVESPSIEVVELISVNKLEATPVEEIGPRMIKETKNVRFKDDVELAMTDPVTLKDVDSPPIELVGSTLLDNLEPRAGKGTEPSLMQDAKDLGSVKDVELKKAAAPVTVRDVEPSPIKVVESNLEEKLEATPVKGTQLRMKEDAEDLSLAKDVEVLKSKLLELESKVGQAENNISKLEEERRLTIQEREFLQREMAILKTQRIQKTVHDGYPPLFLWLVAIFSIVIGYRLHP